MGNQVSAPDTAANVASPSRLPVAMALCCAFALSIPLGGCKNSPTEPTDSIRFGVAGAFQCLDGSRIIQFQLLLDDKLIQDVSLSPPTNLVTVDGQKSDFASGSHRLRLKIARQTATPSRYSAWGLTILTVDSIGSVTNRVDLSDQNRVLSTGEYIEYAFQTR